jgi:hypothetical protein
METVSAKRDSPTGRESPYEPFGDDRPRILIEGVGALPMSATGTPQQKQGSTTDGPTAPHARARSKKRLTCLVGPAKTISTGP